MRNPKENIVILTYVILIYQFITGEYQSIFVYLFSVLIELLLMVVLYVIVNKSNSVYSWAKNFNILFTAVLFLLFNYALILFAAEEFDNLKEFQTGTEQYGLLPFFVFKNQIILVVVGLIVAYFMEFRKIRKQEKIAKKVEWEVFLHIAKVWGLVGLTVAILNFVPEQYYPIGIAILPIGRIIMEFYARKNSMFK